MVDVSKVLKRPYQRILIPDEDSGTYTALISEFPGCIAQGDTPAEAYESLERAAESWLEGTLAGGLPIPEPNEEQTYSGRVLLRMPRSLHRRAAEVADHEDVSLNTFLVAAISERLGAHGVQRELATGKRELGHIPGRERKSRGRSGRS